MIEFLEEKHGLISPFGVCTSFAFNSGGRVCMESHRDPNNFAGSFCVVVSFGSMDSRESAFLVVRIGDTEYRFELPVQHTDSWGQGAK